MQKMMENHPKSRPKTMPKPIPKWVEILMTDTKDKLNKFLKKTGAIDISYIDK